MCLRLLGEKLCANFFFHCPRWANHRTDLINKAAGRWGDLSFLLAEKSHKRNRDRSRALDEEHWAPNMDIIQAKVKFAQPNKCLCLFEATPKPGIGCYPTHHTSTRHLRLQSYLASRAYFTPLRALLNLPLIRRFTPKKTPSRMVCTAQNLGWALLSLPLFSSLYSLTSLCGDLDLCPTSLSIVIHVF